MSRIQLLKNVVDGLRSLADDIRAIADALACDETPVKADATSHEPDQPEISLEEVRAILAEKSHDGFTREIRELLLKYGAPKLSEIDPDNYAALMKDAEVLGNAT